MNEPEQKEGQRFPVTKTNQGSDGLEVLPYILPIVFLPMMGVQGVLAFALTVICVVVAIVFHIVKKNEIVRGTEWWELTNEDLVFHSRKGVKRFALSGLTVGSGIQNLKLIVTTPDGKIQNLPHPARWNGTRPVTEEFFMALAKSGVRIEGTRLNLESYDPSDFRISTKLTSAVNWRWEGCVKLDQFQEHKTKLVDTQTIEISDGFISIVRKAVVLLKVPIRNCTLIRVLGGQDDGAMARYLLEVKGKDKWPLLDWNSSKGEILKEALLNRKVPLVQDPPAEEPDTEYLTDVRKVSVSYNDLSHKLLLIALEVPLLVFAMEFARSLGTITEIGTVLLFIGLMALVMFIKPGRYEIREEGISFISLAKHITLKFNPLRVQQTELMGANPPLNWHSQMEPTSTPDFILPGDPGIERLQLLKSLEEKGVQVEVLGVQSLSINDVAHKSLRQSFKWKRLSGNLVGLILTLFIVMFAGGAAKGFAWPMIFTFLGYVVFSTAISLYILSKNEWPSPWNDRMYRISDNELEVSTKRGVLHSIALNEIRHLTIETRKGFIDQNSTRLSVRTLYGRRLVISRWTTRLDSVLLTLISLARGRGVEVIIADQDMVDRHKEGEEGEVLYEANKQEGPIVAGVKAAEEDAVEQPQNA